MEKHIAMLAAMLMVIHITQAQWTNLGENTYPLNADNIINAVVTDISGTVYAAGEFTVRDSVIQYYVAKWTGDSAWVELGTGSHALNANGYIYTLATDLSGHIYAAGAFTDQQYQSEGDIYVAEWSDTGWKELGASGIIRVPNTFGSAIFSVAVDDSGYVYATGEFKDGNNKYYVSKWNGTSWSELGTGSNALNANYSVRIIVADPSSGYLYAAGEFADSPAYRYDGGGALLDSSGYEYVAQWNGTKWTEMGTGANALHATSPIRALTTDAAGNVYVGYDDTAANFYVAHWNGTSWDKVGTGANALNANNTINALTTDAAGNLYAAGNFTDQNGEQYVAEWNGTNWSELGTGTNSLDPNAYILTLATDTAYNVYAAGYFTDGSSKYYVAQYDPNTQGPNGINEATPSLDRLDITPNPTYGLTDITVSTTMKAEINIGLYDMTGRKLATIYQGPTEAGQKNISFDTDGLSSGIYLVKVSDGLSSIQDRFVKL